MIPEDVRQFQLKHMLWLVISFCLPLSLLSHSPVFGIPVLIGVSSFWTGMGCLFISDTIDNRPIDDRGWISQIVNVIGLFIVAFSLTGVVLFILSYIVLSFLAYLQL